MTLSISRLNTPSAVVFTTTSGESSGTLAIPSAMFDGSSYIADAVISFIDAVDGFMNDANNQAKRLLPDALKNYLEQTAGGALSQTYRRVQTEGVKENVAIATAVGRMLNLPTDATSIALRAEDRAVLRSMDHAALAIAITTADLPRLQAIVERAEGTPLQLVEIARERAMRLAFIQQSGIQADYALQPTPDDPLAHGPDEAAAEQAADAAMARHDARRDMVDLTRNLLRDTVAFVSSVIAINRDTAFATLTGKGK